MTIPTCTISAGHVSGSFTVGNVAAGIYTITVTGNPSSDAGTAPLQVLGPTLTLNPTSAPQGTTILVSGSGFWTTDTCGAGLVGSGSIIAVSPPSSCTITQWQVDWNLHCWPSCVVSSLHNYGDRFCEHRECLGADSCHSGDTQNHIHAASGPQGYAGGISASGFSAGDNTHPLTFSASIPLAQLFYCRSFVHSRYQWRVYRNVHGQHLCSCGGYTVTATGFTGDAASFTINVGSGNGSGSYITLTPSSGPPGTLVTFSGVIGPVTSIDTTCSVSVSGSSTKLGIMCDCGHERFIPLLLLLLWQFCHGQ